jgi:beta-lactam-binding protein with PASTA domain
MAARLTVLLPRLLALVVIWLLGWSTYTLAAGTPPSEPQTTTVPAEPAKAAKFLTVPDTRNKAYVFAKGILQDAGFAWRIDGSVQGYAANEVVGQKPAPGTRVLDNGEPVVTLVLERNSKYGERGLPENESPYGGEKIVLASQYWKQQAANKKKEPEQPEQPTSTAPAPEPAPAPTPEPAPEPEPAPAGQRKPDFVVPGAPSEPADEMPLPSRARQLETYLKGKQPTDQVVNHWLYQHSWIVTGALFGWQDGAQALRILIRVDESLQRRWDIGARSEARARRALAEVNRHLQ